MRRELDLPMRGPLRRPRDNLAANELVPPRLAFSPGEKLLPRTVMRGVGARGCVLILKL